MGKEISWDIRERAEYLYTIDGRTYEEVSEATGVSISQLKRWAKEDKWREMRKEYRQAQYDVRYDVVLMTRDLIKEAKKTMNPQSVHAAIRAAKMVDINQGDKKDQTGCHHAEAGRGAASGRCHCAECRGSK